MVTALIGLMVLLQEPAAWEGFAPGAWAEYVTTGKRDGAPLRILERSSFKEATTDDVVISLETLDAAGGRSVVEMKYPLVRRGTPKEDAGRKTGEEKLTIDGQAYACEIIERRGVRRWVCASATANGGVLKSETVSDTLQFVTRILKLKEEIKVGTRTLSCWVREEVTDTGDQKKTRTSWISDEVPGGVVKSEVRQVRGKDVVEETVTNLTGFEVVKKK